MSLDVSQLSDASAGVVEAASAGLVQIEGRCGSTTGSVWSADGVIVATHHAVERDDVTVTLGDGRTLTATVAGRDPGTDVVVLKTDAKDLSALAWSDGEGLKVGHFVLTLGRPGKSARATFGIVSALGEGFRTMSGATIDRYIEVDGTLPRGFSGGALVDFKGRALGMNTAALVRGGVTIPVPTLRRVVGDLLTHGRIGRGYLGLSVYPARLPQAVADKLGQATGLVAVGIEPGGPADTGGLLVGDIVVSIDGVATRRPGDLMSALEGKVRLSVTVKVLRGGELKDLAITTTLRE